jgi:pimeloyl-ACP methyl ester carboxylesterase
MTSFGEHVVALLDHLGADRAVIGCTSLGANVSLEVAVIAPERLTAAASDFALDCWGGAGVAAGTTTARARKR